MVSLRQVCGTLVPIFVGVSWLFTSAPARAQDQGAFPGQPVPQFPGTPIPPFPGQPLPEAPPTPAGEPVPSAPSFTPPPDAEHRAPANWYGWQTLIAVAPFDVAMFAGVANLGTQPGAAGYGIGLAGRSVVPGIVHMAHRRWGAALGTIGLHLGMEAAGLAIAWGVGTALTPPCQPRMPCRNNFESIPSGVQYGPMIGSMTATVLDVVFFAYRQKLSWTAAAPAAPQRAAWALAPYVAPNATGRLDGGLAAAGSF